MICIVMRGRPVAWLAGGHAPPTRKDVDTGHPALRPDASVIRKQFNSKIVTLFPDSNVSPSK